MNIGNCKHRVHHSHFWSLVPKLAPRLPKSCTSYWLLRSNKLLLLHPLPLRQMRTADHMPLDSDCGGWSNFFDEMYLLISRNGKHVCCLRAPGWSSGPASARFLPPPPRSPAAGPRRPSFCAGRMGAKQQLAKSRCNSARPTHYS